MDLAVTAFEPNICGFQCHRHNNKSKNNSNQIKQRVTGLEFLIPKLQHDSMSFVIIMSFRFSCDHYLRAIFCIIARNSKGSKSLVNT